MSGLAVAVRGVGGVPLEAAFEAGPGITVLFGPSGAGKTTLLHAILGAARPREGTVGLGDRVLFDATRRIDVPVRERRIGIVFQDAILFPHLDARDNVAFGLPPGAPRDAAESWLARVGASAVAARSPRALSGGERQRVALARALAAEPSLLLLDEPFTGLDLPARERLGGLLRTLAAETGIPFLHVTHDPAEALRLGDAMVALEAGRVVRRGAPQDVLAPGAQGAGGSTNWLRGAVVEDGPSGARVDLGGVVVMLPSVGRAVGAHVVLALPVEEPVLATTPVGRTSARNVLHGWIEALLPVGDATDVLDVVVATPVALRVRMTRRSAEEMDLVVGARVHLLVKATAFRLAG